jgi:UDP-2,3-diacylglucosamine pyrophosphatase LpxH
LAGAIMRRNGYQDNITIDPEKSIIVVSDLHLGGNQGEKTSNDFSSFLEWLKLLCDESNETKIKIKPLSSKKLKPPQMLILLGDILELWRPRPPLRSELFNDFFPLISKLLELPIPIVYVTGNHDREICEFMGAFPDSPEIKSKFIIEADQFPCSKIPGQLINEHGLKLGNKYEYTFLHGQQFDRKFKITHVFSEYPGWVCNNSSIFEMHPFSRPFIWSFCAFGIIYFLLIGPKLDAVYHIPPLFNSILLVLTGISIPLVAISIPTQLMDYLYNTFHSQKMKKILSFFPKFSYFSKKKRIDYLKKARDFTRKKDEGGTNVVVSGHTHWPVDYENYECNKRMVNSGSWVSEVPFNSDPETGFGYHIVGKDKESHIDAEIYHREYVCNTFIYLDKEMPLTLIWDTEDEKNPEARYLKIKGRDSGFRIKTDYILKENP